MTSLAKRVIRQIAGDKRTVALLLIAPMLIMFLLSLLLGDSAYTPIVAIQESELPAPLVSALREQDIELRDTTHIDIKEFDARQYLLNHREVDLVFMMSPDGVLLYAYESNIKSGAAMKAVQSAIASLNPVMQVKTQFAFGDAEESLFESMGYLFLGIIAFFLIFIVSGMALVRERSAGTLERMLMTPISRQSVIGGYTIGFSFFAILQAILLVIFGVYVLGIHNEGQIGWVILIMLLLAIAAVSFGELISVFANTEFQVVQMIPIAIIPQIFFSGIIPLDTIPYHLGNLCYIMPIYYGCAAIKEVMALGNGFEAIWPFVLALLLYTVVLSVLNAFVLKRYRRL